MRFIVNQKLNKQLSLISAISEVHTRKFDNVSIKYIIKTTQLMIMIKIEISYAKEFNFKIFELVSYF